MRKLYFVRHGLPEFPGGEKMYVGTTDLPLSTPGKLQACLTGIWLRQQSFTAVASSPLTRARETAEQIAPEYFTVDDLHEMYAGEWEGLTFREVREKWPGLFQLRNGNGSVPIPGAEGLTSCRERFSGAVEKVLDCTEGDVVIVAHITVLRSFLSKFMSIPLTECRSLQIPHASVSILELGETPQVTQVGMIPEVTLTDECCTDLMKAAGADEKTILHCRAVAEKAAAIAGELNAAGCSLNTENLRRAALVHDIARREPNHAATGGEWLTLIGRTEEAKLVSRHHSVLPVEVSEAGVLSLADRLISGTEEVNLEVRFQKSLTRCTGEEAKSAHSARLENAKALQKLFDGICGKRTETGGF